MNSQAEFQRNLGFFSLEEQDKISNSTVAIAGAGGDGGLLAIQLARLGFGEIRVADPENFEAENSNRQALCTTKTIGQNKAQVVADHIRDINPRMDVSVYAEGVVPDNVKEFIAGADLVVDETEFTQHQIGVMIARVAREENVPNLMAMNVGFGSVVTSFHPAGKTFESMLRLDESTPLDEIANQEVSLKHWLPYIPPYADIDMFKEVAEGKKSAPSVAPGVAIAAGVAATQATLHILKGNNRPEAVFAPRYHMVDAVTAESKIIKHPVLSHYKYLSKLILDNYLGRVPKVSF